MGIADVIAFGVVAAPLCYGALYVAGTLGAGPLSDDDAPAASRESEPVDLDDSEAIAYRTGDRSTHWKPVLAAGVCLVPFFWGIPLCVYALRLRNRPEYVVTDRRIIRRAGGDEETFPLSEVGQLQTGASIPERLTNRGHVQFSVNNRRLETIGGLSNPASVAGLIRESADGARS